MDYEKKYKESLALMVNCIPDEDGYVHVRPQDIFIELKESEDEKIRREIMEYITLYKDSLDDDEYKSWISWLEKQGEQKSTLRERYKNIAESEWFKKTHEGMSVSDDEKVDNVNKIEPKFNVGDWVISPNCVYWHIDAIQNGRYEVTTDTGQCGNWPLDTNIYRLWTIQDARPGDVLTNGDFPCIFKRCDGNGSLYVYCGINAHNDFSILSEDSENIWDDYSKQYFPATKEQRDTLFTKMKESGYEWLEETKELKKIKQKSAEWSEEDEEMFKSIMATCELAEQERDSSPARHLLEMQLNWLKSLKQRIGG